jgi:trehalose 6-phosphate synthase
MSTVPIQAAHSPACAASPTPAVVTPLRDGMNLVAKELVAAQDSDDPGVLVLSQFAGAANELDGALIVNPHETDEVAAALKRALEMSLPERRERHATMFRRLMDWDIETWAEKLFVGARR